MSGRAVSQLLALARAHGWPVRPGRNAAAVELPSGAVVAILPDRRTPDTWHIMAHAVVTGATLESRNGYDLASAIAELIAQRTLWDLHRAADAAPHLVDVP